jgi:hypothetical protein
MTQLESPRIDPPDTTAYRERLRQLLRELRQIEGFPIGSDEDILALSDPPYYTACPNPFLGEFIAEHGTPYDEATDDYHREPFAADVSEGKNDPIYNAHSYHTKVPHKAIMRYILHYSKPGDIVFDGFCGSGMTGVAAQLCGDPDPEFKLKVENEWRAAGHPPPEWGARKAILCDLSPAATFIAYNLNRLSSLRDDLERLEELSAKLQRSSAESLTTAHTGEHRSGTPAGAAVTTGEIQYTVWSDLVRCATCGNESPLWDLVYAGRGKEPNPNPVCSACEAAFPRNPERVWRTVWDPDLQQQIRQGATEPVQLNYGAARGRYEKRPDRADIARATTASTIASGMPILALQSGFNTDQPIRSHGFTHVHHFFSPRNRLALGELFGATRRLSGESRASVMFILTSLLQRVFRLNRYMPRHDRHVGPLSGTLYVSAITAEIPVVHYFRDKLKEIGRAAASRRTRKANARIATHSADDLRELPDHSIDYIFTDPPFGGNLNYSELNLLYEAFLGVQTNATPEAVVNPNQQKGLADYQRLMERCFAEFHRVLKPGRWMTVEFHNSQNRVWASIQEALTRAGFIVADVRTLDKQKGTTKQLSYQNAVKQDLVISAYKLPTSLALTESIDSSEARLWEFVDHHLSQLPVFDPASSTAPIVEREDYLLYDRAVAYFVSRGAFVPLSAAAFYAGLRDRYPERERMYFLPWQVAEWDRAAAQQVVSGGAGEQLPTYIADEKTALAYLRGRLTDPASYQDLYTDFLSRLHPGVSVEVPELRQLLEENFVQSADGHWRIADPANEEDLRRLRERRLLKDYEQYLSQRARLKRVRPEAIAAGFSAAWNRRDYGQIVDVGRRLPESALEDPTLLMYYDNALLRNN